MVYVGRRDGGRGAVRGERHPEIAHTVHTQRVGGVLTGFSKITIQYLIDTRQGSLIGFLPKIPKDYHPAPCW